MIAWVILGRGIPTGTHGLVEVVPPKLRAPSTHCGLLCFATITMIAGVLWVKAMILTFLILYPALITLHVNACAIPGRASEKQTTCRVDSPLDRECSPLYLADPKPGVSVKFRTIGTSPRILECPQNGMFRPFNKKRQLRLGGREPTSCRWAKTRTCMPRCGDGLFKASSHV